MALIEKGADPHPDHPDIDCWIHPKNTLALN